MHTGEELPLVKSGTNMREAIMQISQKGFGCAGVLATDGSLAGIITDGDLRRHIDGDLLAMAVDEVMTADPKTVSPDQLAATALTIVNTSAITTLMVVEDNQPVGLFTYTIFAHRCRVTKGLKPALQFTPHHRFDHGHTRI